MFTLILVLCTLTVLLGGHLLRRRAARYEPARSRQWGPFSIELRRRVLVRGHPDGRGRHAMAQPCESRVRVFRVAGVPVWQQTQDIDLPTQVANMAGTLTARDFDVEFDPRFRETGFLAVLPRWVDAWRAERGCDQDPRARRMGADLLHK